LVKFFLLHIEKGDALEAGHILRIDFKHVLVFFNGLLRIAQIVGGFHAGNILLRVGGGQVHLGDFQIAVKAHGILEMLDGLFIVGSPVCLHTLVELVARPEFVAARRGQQTGCNRQYRHESCGSVHVCCSPCRSNKPYESREKRSLAGPAACRRPHAEESNSYCPASILAVIKPTRSTTLVPCAISITWATF